MDSILQTPSRTRASDIAHFFDQNGYGPFLGVPCGILAPLFEELQGTAHGFTYSPREDNAIAMACGALTAGRRPVAVMQNSGLAQSVNALASLAIPYRFPLAMVISLRGVAPDHTAENQVMGAVTQPLLDSLGIPYRVLQPETYHQSLQWLHTTVTGTDAGPAAVLIEPAFFEWSPTT